MNDQNVTMKDILAQWYLIVISIIIFAFIAFIVSVLLPAKYQSDISVIVVQEQASEKVDAFSATKSAEFLSNIFTRVIYTTSFFNDVQNAPFDVRRDFSHDSEEREKEWKKFISVNKVNNTGIINISVVDVSRKTAEETAKAVAYILTTDSEKYHGGGDRVTVRLIDGPNTPIRPTLPRILPNTVIGALFGFMVAIIFVYFFPHKFLFTKNNKESDVDYNQDTITTDEFETENSTIDDHFKNAIVFDKEDVVSGQVQEGNLDVVELHNRISNFHNQNI